LLQCALELSGRKLRSYGILVISTIIHRFAEVGGITQTYHYPKNYATSTEGGGISSPKGGFSLSLTSGAFTKYAQHFTTTTRDVKRNEKLTKQFYQGFPLGACHKQLQRSSNTVFHIWT